MDILMLLHPRTSSFKSCHSENIWNVFLAFCYLPAKTKRLRGEFVILASVSKQNSNSWPWWYLLMISLDLEFHCFDWTQNNQFPCINLNSNGMNFIYTILLQIWKWRKSLVYLVLIFLGKKCC